MPNTDFFDDDLVRKRDDVKRVHVGVGDPDPDAFETEEDAAGGSGDLNVSGMARYRQKINGQAAEAAEELERLELRRSQLESEKVKLQEIRRKQSAYEEGKREMLTHLTETLVSLEREEVRASQVCELLKETRRRFRQLLEPLESVQEDSWPEERIQQELERMLAFVEEARREYNQSMGRIKALTGGGGADAAEMGPADYVPPSRPVTGVSIGWVEWLKIGAAVSLPIVGTMLLLAVIYWVLRGAGLL